MGTGEEAIRRIATSEPDVVLLDMRLPGMNGLDVLKSIHASAPATEVVMLTGHGSIDTAIESIRIGAFRLRCEALSRSMSFTFAFKGQSSDARSSNGRIFSSAA